jgi:glutamate dehydrogenase/leucine dehydrogenase
MAALGVFTGIIGILESMYDDVDLSNRTIAIKGVGKLGSELLRLLYEKNVKIYYSDIDNQKNKLIKGKYPNAILVSTDKIHMIDADVYSPCALGNEFTEKKINTIKAKSIVGGSNNQIPSLEIADQLFNKGIIYAPDYVVNAGGLINIVDELENDGYKHERVKYRINNIKKTLQKIIQLSERERISTHTIADNMAIKIIKK